MNIELAKKKFHQASIYHSEKNILEHKSIIGYEKKFKWSWMATQLNTFIVVTDFGNKEIDKSLIENHLSESFKFSKQNYKGWPRGLQSGVGVISILISNNITEEAKIYCQKLKSGKNGQDFLFQFYTTLKPMKHFSSKKIRCGEEFTTRILKN